MFLSHAEFCASILHRSGHAKKSQLPAVFQFTVRVFEDTVRTTGGSSEFRLERENAPKRPWATLTYRTACRSVCDRAGSDNAYNR